MLHGVGPRSLIIDGKVLPYFFMTAFKQGKFNHVPIINGTNRDEGTILTALLFDLAGKRIETSNYSSVVKTIIDWEAEFIPELTHKTLNVASIIREYPLSNYSSPGLAASAIITDSLLACPSFESNLLLAHQSPIWVYEFSDKDAPEIVVPPVRFPYGATHFSEIQYLFDISALSRKGSASLSPAQLNLSRQMILYWTNFAYRGNPNDTETTLHWPPFGRSTSSPILKLDQPSSTIETNFWTLHKCDFWKQLRNQAALAH